MRVRKIVIAATLLAAFGYGCFEWGALATRNALSLDPDANIAVLMADEHRRTQDATAQQAYASCVETIRRVGMQNFEYRTKAK